MKTDKSSQTKEELEKIEEESEKLARPDQKAVVTVSPKLRKRLHNLPDPSNPPLGWDEHKGFGRVYPYLKVPALHPRNHGDTVMFNALEAQANRLYLGDNLEVLRTLPAESIDLIYIDPPFFSGRNYNVIWGDTNEVRTFEDIWEGGITTYLIWLNARLWEMRRVLKKTGSIYVHCDWHASHYIKTEMDKIFGYENFRNEILTRRGQTKNLLGQFDLINRLNIFSDSILWYSKDERQRFTAPLKEAEEYQRVGSWQSMWNNADRPTMRYELLGTKIDKGQWKWVKDRAYKAVENYKRYEQDKLQPSLQEYWEKTGRQLQFVRRVGKSKPQYWIPPRETVIADTNWFDIKGYDYSIGYPTQKSEDLLERIVLSGSKEGEVVADFFCGGGTTLAVAQKLKRRFVGCDSSRVAISVTLDRLVKVGEEMSGVQSNISVDEKSYQLKLQAEGVIEKVPNTEVWYLGVYPVEKFQNLEKEEFNDFVLTAYDASKNTGEGVTSGYRPPGQQEPILVGPSNPNEFINTQEIKKFFDEVKAKLEPNKQVRAKIVAWRFSRQDLVYIKTLRGYVEKHNLPLELEAIPLDSKEFRSRILQRLPDIEENEFFLRFSKAPAIGDIKIKKTGPLEYEFEAIDALSTNEDGWLVNCQWDFDYQEGHFGADKDYVLVREKRKDKKRGEIFEAILKAKHKFEKGKSYTVACKVQDNLAGETILSKKIVVEK